MRILFITDDFYPNFGANSLIVKALSEQLIQNGNCVSVMSFAGDRSLPQEEVWNGIHVVRIVNGNGKSGLIDLMKKHRFVDAVTMLTNWISNKIGGEAIWHKENIVARCAIEKLINEKKIDLVVTVNCSIECSFPVYHLKRKNKISCQWLFYMLDPFATHSYYLEHYSKRQLQKVQHKLLAACDKVLCSDVIAEEIKNCETPEIIQKLEVAEYPKIQDIRANVKIMPLDKKNTHCVCVGSFNQQVRPANYLFDVIDRLKDTKLVFHFVGIGWDHNNEFATAERTNCIFHGEVAYNEALSFECSCDFLINIGNKVKNQFPSKVLEYVCSGKPVIDFSKYRRGLTEKYLCNYPNALIVCEDENVNDGTEKVRRFTAAKHKQLEYAAVKECFAAATPEHVVTQLLTE